MSIIERWRSSEYKDTTYAERAYLNDDVHSNKETRLMPKNILERWHSSKYSDLTFAKK